MAVYQCPVASACSLKGNENVGGRKNDMQLERIRSKVHSDNITKNILFL